MFSAIISVYTAKITLLTGLGFAYHKLLIDSARYYQNSVPRPFNNNLENSPKDLLE